MRDRNSSTDFADTTSVRLFQLFQLGYAASMATFKTILKQKTKTLVTDKGVQDGPVLTALEFFMWRNYGCDFRSAARAPLIVPKKRKKFKQDTFNPCTKPR